MSTPQKTIPQHIGNLVVISFKFSSPLSQLMMIREKIIARNYQSFDKPDIMDELGRLQQIARELHGEMIRIHDLLNEKG